ncbi:MAG: hypothetical protein HC915_00310 [Anaerolineae bacterium]|nr:hypothetical protein [Anaerolineae bacterium]
MLSQTLITQAHIAESDPDQQAEASQHYQRARETLREYGSPLDMARTLVAEARYQQGQGNLAETERLAREAHTLLQELALEEEAELARKVLESIHPTH